MPTPILVTGDDISMAVTLKKDGVTFTINPAADVKASLVSLDHTTVYSDPVAQSSAASGADWANSLVTIQLPEANTLNMTYQGPALLEVQVNDTGGKVTFFTPVNIVLGSIA